jgi:hypothetical protein
MRSLKKYYNFDNKEFINYLKKKGFYVASKSNANYLITAHSLASSLNMEYINYLSDKVGVESRDMLPLYNLMNDYKVWRFLKSIGYKFIHFGSWYTPMVHNKYADMNFNIYSLQLPEFSMILYKSTMLYPVISKIGLLNLRKIQRKRLLYKFEELSKIPKIKEPTFVMAHMLIPHFPFVFDRNGNFPTENELKKRGKRVNFIEQLIYANKKVKELIDKLLSNSKVPPIIILQADEAQYPPRFNTDPPRDNNILYDWRKATDEELKEKMGILNAFYLPNVDKSILYPSITPVNNFIVVFNLYFGTNLKLLPDECYAFVDIEHPYKFFKITDRVKYD